MMRLRGGGKWRRIAARCPSGASATTARASRRSAPAAWRARAGRGGPDRPPRAAMVCPDGHGTLVRGRIDLPRAMPDTTTMPRLARSVPSASAMRIPLAEALRAPTMPTLRGGSQQPDVRPGLRAWAAGRATGSARSGNRHRRGTARARPGGAGPRARVRPRRSGGCRRMRGPPAWARAGRASSASAGSGWRAIRRW